MLVPLVPLILAANISVSETDWENGAEVIYDGNIVGWTPPLDAAGRSMVFNTTMKMKCRLNALDILRCYLDEPRVVVTLLTASGESRVVVNSTDQFADPDDPMDRFDVKLSKDGLEFKIDVPAFLKPEVVFVKALADQLNIAKNWDVEDGERDIEEFSTLGKCKAKFTMMTARNETDDVGTDRPYKIVIEPESKGTGSKVLREIQKIRDVDSCYVRFSSRAGVDIQLKSSISRTIVTEDGFTSFTETELIFNDRTNPDDTGKIGRERVTLSLDRIVPALGGPLPEVNPPYSMFPNQLIVSLFYSGSFDYLIEKPQRQYAFWLSAALGNQP